MKSGLEGRNNAAGAGKAMGEVSVSMKSGLEGRNNLLHGWEQSRGATWVSMKSGLEGRNNDMAAMHEDLERLSQ